MNNIIISEVKGRRDLNKFIAFPNKLSRMYLPTFLLSIAMNVLF